MRTKPVLLAPALLAAILVVAACGDNPPEATVVITLDDDGLNVEHDGVSDPNDPVRIRVSTPAGDYTIESSSLKDAVDMVQERSEQAYKDLADIDMIPAYSSTRVGQG